MLAKSVLVVPSLLKLRRRNLNRQSFGTLLLVVLFGAQFFDPLLAGDFWNEKPYTQWSAEETLRMLSDSPWCKTHFLKLSGGTSRTPPTSVREIDLGEATISQHSICCRTFETVTAPVPGRSNGNASSDAPGASTQTPGSNSGGNILTYRVLWLSSVCIRQAMTRALQLQGVDPTDSVKRAIEQPAGEFVIAVTGPWMTPFDGISLQRLKKKAYLNSVKTSTKKVEPRGYIPPRERQDGMAVFIFPRAFDAKPAFDQSDGGVEFVFDDRSFRIQVRFKLDKMVSHGILDL